MARFNKYDWYERSVQTPESHIEQFVSIYRDLNGKYARRLREDFCGTFRLSAEWVRRNRRNSAVGLDLDPEPLAYGKRHSLKRLNQEQRSRLTILRQDVNSITAPKVDLIIACNFSFFIFKTRKALIEYFRFCRRSLAPGGVLILEVAGGPGMIEPVREKKPVFNKNGKRIFSYVWDQKSFDPITHDGEYAIHFELPDGKKLKNVFTYDWRVWSLPELRECMTDAGFDRTHAYWETSHRGRGTGEYAITEKGDNAYAWIAYAVGVRAPKPRG